MYSDFEINFSETGINFSTINTQFFNSSIEITIKDSNGNSWTFNEGLNENGLGGTGYGSITSNGTPLINPELKPPLNIKII